MNNNMKKFIGAKHPPRPDPEPAILQTRNKKIRDTRFDKNALASRMLLSSIQSKSEEDK